MTQPILTGERSNENLAKTFYADFTAKAREAVAEGCVLLRNENQALPLEEGCRIAVFGRAQMNYFKSGMGSGGMVNVRYIKGVWEALAEEKELTPDMIVRDAYEAFVVNHPFDNGCGWATEPWFQAEMPLDEAFVQDAAARNDAAIVIIGRTAGGQAERQHQHQRTKQHLLHDIFLLFAAAPQCRQYTITEPDLQLCYRPHT